MQQKNILFLGFGDLAARTCRRLTSHRCVGVARSAKSVAAGVELWRGAAGEAAITGRIEKEYWDAVVITLTPAAHSDEAYQEAYVRTLQKLLPVWTDTPPGLVLFASSTGVYAQSDGSWVNEESPTEPESFNGRQMLEAEAMLRTSNLKHCIVRFAGIYGPGRDFLLRQVREGKGGSGDFTNRIHAEDCAGVLSHLLLRHFTQQPLESLYLACDSEPAPGNAVRSWLAEQLGLQKDLLQPSEGMRAGNKRCSNQRLLASGYHLLYPSFRDGYREILAHS